jgi:ribosome-associated translation inhibitor RaiA
MVQSGAFRHASLTLTGAVRSNASAHGRAVVANGARSAFLTSIRIIAMNIRIQVRHDAAAERIQRYITTEFEHVAAKFEIISAEFIVDQEGSNGHLKTFEAIIKVPGDVLTVHEKDVEAHKAIDASMKVIEKLLKRHKETHAKPGNLIRHKEAREEAS